MFFKAEFALRVVLGKHPRNVRQERAAARAWDAGDDESLRRFHRRRQRHGRRRRRGGLGRNSRVGGRRDELGREVKLGQRRRLRVSQNVKRSHAAHHPFQVTLLRAHRQPFAQVRDSLACALHHPANFGAKQIEHHCDGSGKTRADERGREVKLPYFSIGERHPEKAHTTNS